MSVRIVDVREVTKPISSPIRNAYIDFSKMTTSLVAVVTDAVRDGKRVVGYGFNSNGRYGQGGLIRERFAPRLMEADPKTLLDASGDNLDPDKIWATLMSNEKPGGHGERSVAVGTIDMAVWDAVAKMAGKPLFRLLAERRGRTADPRVFVYAAGGYYYPGKDLSALRGEMRGYLDRGYNVVKMKIGGAPIEEDRARIEAVLSEIGAQAQLAVDANGRFDLETAIAYAKMLRDYPLFWYEEAGDPLDFSLQAALAEFYPGPMATGENLFSHQDARNLIRYGGMRPDRDWLQFDCALSYGLCEYQRTLAVLQTHGWSPGRCVPHGGHQMSLNIAAGLGLGGNESYPDLFQPYGGFPDGVRVENGHIAMPELPGIGFEGKSDLYTEMKSLAS
jgi:L-alanine-DL-glutamate epimerase-like enolase superfamily enzyme